MATTPFSNLVDGLYDEFSYFLLAQEGSSPAGKVAKEKVVKVKEQPLGQEQMAAEGAADARSSGFSIKRLIRLLHIDRPTVQVMAILGKR